MKSTNHRLFKVSAMALSVATVLFTQQTAQAASEELEEIQVTGTRIRTTDGMVTPTPVTSVTMADISDLRPGISISEQLDALPQFLNTQTAQRSGATLFGDAGGSYLNLRNMGKQRTLILFDGSRIVPADRSSSVNVDNLPTALVRSVDVVTGGASAAYGADALAGVVNFVLDRDFEGVKTSVSSGITEMGDGENWNFSVAGGKQIGDRLNLIGSIESRQVKQILRSPYDTENWNSIGLVINPAWTPGNTSVPQRITAPNVHSATQSATGLISQTGFGLNRYTFSEDGKSVRPFVSGDIPNRFGAGTNNMQSGGPEAELAKRSYLNGPTGNEVKNRSAFGAIKYSLSASTELFGQVMLGRTESNGNNLLGSGNWAGTNYFLTAYVDNPFLPDVVRNAMIAEKRTSIQIQKSGQIRIPGRFNIDDGRDNRNISQMFSTSAGFDHDFENGWNLRATYQYGESKLTSAGYPIVRSDRLAMALDAVRNPTTGAIICNVQSFNPTPEQLAASVKGLTTTTPRLQDFPSGAAPALSPIWDDNAIRDCVPLNMFGLASASREASSYVMGNKKGFRDLDQHFAEILLTGELHEGWGAGPISFAAGLTWRDEWFNQYATPVESEQGPLNAPSVGIRGIAGGPISGNRSLFLFTATSWATGAFNVWEAFSEVNVPIWESASGNQRFDTTVAYRSSDYSLTGRIESWKLGGEIQLMDGLRIRATRSRDVREPTFGELFEVTGGGATINDPSLNGATSFITAQSGGNPNLRPEIADTMTAGIVWQPGAGSWISGFEVSADWYEIDMADRVGSLGAQRIVNDCFAGAKDLCSLIVRGSDGRVQQLLNGNLNVSAALTSGVDLEMRYDMEPDFFSNESEQLGIRFLAGYLGENSVQATPGAINRDDVGSLNSPEWSAVASAHYNLGPYGISLVGNYYGDTKNNILWVEGRDVDDNSVASQTTANLVFSYSGETAAGANWVTSLNVANLFNRDAPIAASENQGGGQQPQNNQYDIYGRRYQLSLNYTF